MIWGKFWDHMMIHLKSPNGWYHWGWFIISLGLPHYFQRLGLDLRERPGTVMKPVILPEADQWFQHFVTKLKPPQDIHKWENAGYIRIQPLNVRICNTSPGRRRGGRFEKKSNYYRKKMAQRKVFQMQKHRSIEVVRRTNEWANERTWKNPCTSDWTSQWTKPMNQWANESTISVNRWKNEAMNQGIGRWINQSMKQGISESTKQRSGEPMNHLMSEVVSRCAHESMKPWIYEATKQWTNDPRNQRNKESMNQWVSESTSQWSNESMKQWTNESVNERMNKWMSERKEGRKDGWIMDGWMDEWVTFLCWATSSLSSLFAEAPLLSATFPLSSHLSGLPLLWFASQLALL